jgi:hypothetical protein
MEALPAKRAACMQRQNGRGDKRRFRALTRGFQRTSQIALCCLAASDRIGRGATIIHLLSKLVAAVACDPPTLGPAR